MLGLATVAHGQANYDVYIGGQVVGRGKFYIKRTSGGGLENYFSLYFTTREGKSEFAARGTYDSKGRPQKENFVQKTPAGKRITLLTYGAKSVSANITTDGRKSVKSIPYPKGERVRVPSTFWFVNTKPRIGSEDIGYEFNSDLLRFEARAVRYIGDEIFKFQGKTLTGHKVMNGPKVMWLDGKGMPLKIDLGSAQLLRKG